MYLPSAECGLRKDCKTRLGAPSKRHEDPSRPFDGRRAEEVRAGAEASQEAQCNLILCVCN